MALAIHILVLSLVAQAPDPEIRGRVVTDKGEPASGTLVLDYRVRLSPPVPQVATAMTDGKGQFLLNMPAPTNAQRGMTFNGNRSRMFAYRKGSALAVSDTLDRTTTLRLREAAPRVVTVQRADGKPMVGVKVMPRLIRASGGSIAEIPMELSGRLAATTGPDGKATLEALAAWDELMAVWVAGESVSGQDIMLADRPGQAGAVGPAIIVVRATSRISGRVVDEQGRGVAGQEIEVWTKGNNWVYPNPMGFAGGPLRTDADGSFRTPPGLLVGSTFRVVVRAPGKGVVVGDWVTLGSEPLVVPEIAFGALRTIRGRVVDRAGRPVADSEVLQRGDGPEPTSVKSDTDGRFSLGGFRIRPVLLLARKQGFRFHGQLVRLNEGDVTVILSRRDEATDKEIMPLPYPEMPADAAAIARRLIEPVLEAALRRNDTSIGSQALECLADADPASALEKLDFERRIDEPTRDRVRFRVIESLARTDPEEAAGLAEAMTSADHAARCLLRIARALPAARRAMKLELLDRAQVKARAEASVGSRLRQTAAIANLWCDLGEVEKARKLVMETLPVARHYAEKRDIYRGFFASALARVDLPEALAMTAELEDRDKDRVMGLIAIRLAAVDPAESEKLWRGVKRWIVPESLEGCYRLAMADPERARRIAATHAESGRIDYYLMLALGLVPRDRAAARAAFQQGLDQVDALMDSPYAHLRADLFLRTALEYVDRIDPLLAPDVFWRYLATRPSGKDPRDPSPTASPLLIEYVARYNRYIARILFEPVRARISRATSGNAGGLANEVGNWTLLDPGEAIAVAEKLPIDPARYGPAESARLQVARALTREDWRRRYDFLP